MGKGLARRDPALTVPVWGGRLRPEGVDRAAERALDVGVGRWLAETRIPALPVAGPGSARSWLDRNAIALLAAGFRAGFDPPSPGWLGRFGGRARPRASGLWNTDHVGDRRESCFTPDLAILLGVPDPACG